MSISEILLIAIGLSMDSVAVSLGLGASIKRFFIKIGLRIALFLAVFQAAMPLIGYLVGVNFKQIIQSYDHWIAFAILVILGLKMLYESFYNTQESNSCLIKTPSSKMLVSLSLATSIDALAVGVSFAFLQINICLATALIGITTFLLSILAVWIGTLCGARWKNKAELLGGLILIAIGIKILIEHLHQ